MTTTNKILSLFLLKKEVTYCLVSSYGLFWPAVFKETRKDLPKKEDLSDSTNCLPSYPSTLMLMATILKSQPEMDVKEKGNIKATLL